MKKKFQTQNAAPQCILVVLGKTTTELTEKGTENILYKCM